MIQLTPKDRLEHKASWHDVTAAEGARLCAKHARLLAADYKATKDRLFAECVRAKLGILPQSALLASRLKVMVKGRIHWLTLDGEAIAIFTHPTTDTRGFRYVLTWYFKSLVDTGGN